MNKEEYAQYRLSDSWKEKRKTCMALHEYRCQVCGCTQWRRMVDVHHLHYKNVGNENQEDLIPLCTIHHELIHNQPDGYDMAVVNRLRAQCKELHWNDPMPSHVRFSEINRTFMQERLCPDCFSPFKQQEGNSCCEICGTNVNIKREDIFLKTASS